MYANNGKISSRQLFRLYVFDLVGIGTLLIPSFLARTSGMEGIISIFIGSILGFIYAFYLGVVIKKRNRDIPDWVRSIGFLFLFFHCVLTGGFLSYVFCELIQYSLVKEVGFSILLITTIVVVCYSVLGGIENRARIYEVVFWIILIPYGIMMLTAIKNCEPLYLEPVSDSGIFPLLKNGYVVLAFFTPLFFLLFLHKQIKQGEDHAKVIKTVVAALLVASSILAGSYIILLGNFGQKALATMEFPVITLMSTIQWKGNFLKRMDALMLGVWFFTILALLNLHMDFGARGLKKLVPNLRRWSVPVTAVSVSVVALLLHADVIDIRLFLRYYGWVATPIMLIVPGLLLFVGTEKKETGRRGKGISRMFLILLIGVVGTNLVGCQATQLENRNFPMLVAVDFDNSTGEVLYYESMAGQSMEETKIPMGRGENFKESKDNFQMSLSKTSDYNHLKVIVYGKTLVENREIYEDMIKELVQGEDFPRNTYVCVTDEVTKIIQLEDVLSQEIGTYLEEYLEHHEDGDTKILSLGKILDEDANHRIPLEAWVLKVEEDCVKWEGFFPVTEEGLNK